MSIRIMTKQSIGIMVLVMILSTPLTSLAYFMDFANGVRPSGMGEAFVAVADDANTGLFNPAGYAQMNSIELMGMYSDLYSGLDVRLYNDAQDRFGYNFLSLAVPVAAIGGALGVGWTQFDTVLYKENTFTLSYGKNIWAPYTLDSDVAVDVGASLKMLNWAVTVDEQFSADYGDYAKEKYGVTMDAGLLVTAMDAWRIGFSVDNVIPANMGVSCEEIIPAVYRLGTSYIYRMNAKQDILSSVMATTELSVRNHVYLPKFGMESWWLDNLFAFRAGVNTDRVTGGLSFRNWWHSDTLNLQMDYAFSYPFQMKDTMGSHRMGMTLSWGGLPGAADPVVLEIHRIDKVNKALKEIEQLCRKIEDRLGQEKNTETKHTAETAETMAADIQQSREWLENAKLHAKIAEMEVSEIKSKNSERLQTAQTLCRHSETLIRKREKDYQTIMLALHTPVRETKVLSVPEKYKDKIIVAVDEKIGADFLGTREIKEKLQYVLDYLAGKLGIPIEWRYTSAPEMFLDYKNGEVDVVITYQSDLSPYVEQGLLVSALTAQTRGKTTQACCLLVLEKSGIKTLDGLKGKKIGCSNPELVANLKGIFPDVDLKKAVADISMQRNAQGSLEALKYGGVDAVLEYEYIETIIQKDQRYPKVAVLTRSKEKSNQSIFMRNHSIYPEKAKQMKKLSQALLDCYQDPKIQQILEFFGIDRLVEINQ